MKGGSVKTSMALEGSLNEIGVALKNGLTKETVVLKSSLDEISSSLEMGSIEMSEVLKDRSKETSERRKDHPSEPLFCRVIRKVPTDKVSSFRVAGPLAGFLPDLPGYSLIFAVVGRMVDTEALRTLFPSLL